MLFRGNDAALQWQPNMLTNCNQPIVAFKLDKSAMWLLFPCRFEYRNTEGGQVYAMTECLKLSELAALFGCSVSDVPNNLSAIKKLCSDHKCRVDELEKVVSTAWAQANGHLDVAGTALDVWLHGTRSTGGPSRRHQHAAFFTKRHSQARIPRRRDRLEDRGRRIEKRLKVANNIRGKVDRERASTSLQAYLPTSEMVHVAQRGAPHCLLHAFYMATRQSKFPTAQDMDDVVREHKTDSLDGCYIQGYNMSTLRKALTKFHNPALRLQKLPTPRGGWTGTNFAHALRETAVFLVMCIYNNPNRQGTGVEPIRHCVAFDTRTASIGDSLLEGIEEFDPETFVLGRTKTRGIRHVLSLHRIAVIHECDRIERVDRE